MARGRLVREAEELPAVLAVGEDSAKAVSNGSKLPKFERAPNPDDVGDTVSYTWPRQLYCPISYNNFEVGPYVGTTAVREGETRVEALERLAAEVGEFARGEYARIRDQFCRNYAELMDLKADAYLFRKEKA